MKLWKYFFGLFPARIRGRAPGCTENYSALVLDNTKATSELSECLFWYRASTSIPRFRVGKEIFWRLAEKHARGPEERARNEADRAALSRLEAKSKQGKDRVTVVQRQDEHGRTLKEDRGEGWITLT